MTRIWLRGFLFLSALALVLPVSGARAQDETLDDIQCLVSTFSAAGSTDPEIRTSGISAFMYFLGRLDERSPDYDLKAAIAKQVLAMRPGDISEARERCSAVMTSRGKMLMMIGRDLSQLEAHPERRQR